MNNEKKVPVNKRTVIGRHSLIELVNKVENPTSPAKEKTDEKSVAPSVSYGCRSNIVTAERLRDVQLATMKELSETLSKTYGPMGAFTMVIKGNDPDTTNSKYTKDGLSVMKAITYNKPIESAIRSDIEEICLYVEHQVGDGTTSAVIIAYYVYKYLLNILETFNSADGSYLMPRTLVRVFDDVVTKCCEKISRQGRNMTVNDVYNIAMISTNGNVEISAKLKELYEKYGFDAQINVEISNDQYNRVIEYDGLTLTEGYSNPAFVNNPDKNIVEIHNAAVYYFMDPADNTKMVSLFEKILYDNVIMPIMNGKGKPVPTVILAPMLSRDGSSLLTKVVELLYQYESSGRTNQKPPVLIVTNLAGVDEGVASDIANLCGCKSIKKYINAELEEKDIENGVAPTLETIHSFAGHAELVTATADRTSFINPIAMKENPETYNARILYLEKEIEKEKNEQGDPLIIKRLEKRLQRLRQNHIEYYIGGISAGDRDSLRDLVIDAVKNCSSAAEHGVGYAANFEGLRASYNAMKEYANTENHEYSKDISDLYIMISTALMSAYFQASKILYATTKPENEAADMVARSIIERNKPYNITWDGEPVLCSIETDIQVLRAISKIISMMVTSNQCLLQNTEVNLY